MKLQEYELSRRLSFKTIKGKEMNFEDDKVEEDEVCERPAYLPRFHDRLAPVLRHEDARHISFPHSRGAWFRVTAPTVRKEREVSFEGSRNNKAFLICAGITFHCMCKDCEIWCRERPKSISMCTQSRSRCSRKRAEATGAKTFRSWTLLALEG